MELRKAIMKDYAPNWGIVWLEINGIVKWYMAIDQARDVVKTLKEGDQVLVDVDESDNNLFYLKELE